MNRSAAARTSREAHAKVGRPTQRGGSLASLVVALLALHCQSADDPATGGETHFLKCETQRECLELSPDYVCRDGFCQLPAPEPVTSRGDSGPADVPDAAMPTCPAVAAGELAILGDSFFATTHEITSELERLATEAGLRPEDEPYRDYSRLVANALAFMGNGIADEYASALAEAPVRVVVMNGGGADALLGTCETLDATCPFLVDAPNAAAALFQQMATDGVADIVYAFYPDAVDEATRAKVDALRPLIQAACADAPTRCHWLDLRERFEGNYETYIMDDGLNPTTEGATATAEELWEVMTSNCVGQ